MLLHILTGYSIISLIIMEIIMRNRIGKQKSIWERIGYYIGGLIIGPIAALIGIIMAIIKWDLRGR